MTLSAKRRPTGKEQFLRDATLSLSDIKLIQEAAGAEGDAVGVEAGSGAVAVDESLFEDLDDLDLEDED